VRIEVWLDETAQPIVFERARNAYTKGPLYCVYDGTCVHKFPITRLFRVVESYEQEPIE
jgi:hypothetical protein